MTGDETTEVHLFLAPEVEGLLAENETDVVDLLRRNGVDVTQVTPTSVATADRDEKEPVTVLLASSAVIVSLTPFLTRILATLSRKRVLVEERVPVALEDSQGNVVRDADGRPVVEWVDRHRFAETTPEAGSGQSLEISGPLGLHIGYQDSAKEGGS